MKLWDGAMARICKYWLIVALHEGAENSNSGCGVTHCCFICGFSIGVYTNIVCSVCWNNVFYSVAPD
jgi:hypothetical protein